MSRLEVELRNVSFRLRSPLRTSAGELFERRGVLIVLRAEGRIGVGEATPLESFGTETHVQAQAALARVRVALDGARWPKSLEAVDGLLEELGLAATPACACGVETALMDLLAQAKKVPLASLLVRAPLAPTVAVNALLGDVDPEALRRAASEAVASGFRTVKVKVAGRPLAEDEARLRAVREAAPAVRLRIDANGGWQPGEAIAALRQWAPLKLELCEQPVAADDLEGLARVRKDSGVRIAADEALRSPQAAKEVLLREAADVLVLKPMVLGGLRRAVALAHEAGRRKIGAYVTSALEGPVGRLAALHVAAALGETGFDHGLGVNALFEERFRTLEPVRGALRLPDGDGLGLTD